MKILSDRLLRIKNSAEHSRCTYVDRPPRSADEQFNYTATRRTENVFEKRRLPGSACLFSLESGVALSRAVLRTTPVVVVVSHIQRIGCQPEKTTLHGSQSRSWSAEQGKENKRKSLAAYPTPTPHTARSEKINKITRRIYRRYAGLARSRVRTRIPSARRLGQWVWLRKILHSRLR